MARTVLTPTGAGKPIGMDSAGFTVDPAHLVFVAGQVAMGAEGRVVGKGDLKAQATQVYAYLARCWPRPAARSGTSSSSRRTSCRTRTGRRWPNGGARSTRSSFRTACIRRTRASSSRSWRTPRSSSRWRRLRCSRTGRPLGAGARQGARRAAPAGGARPAVTIHLHGYDLEQTLAPGRPVSMRFTTRATGRFPTEIHAHSQEKERVLGYLEVHLR